VDNVFHRLWTNCCICLRRFYTSQCGCRTTRTAVWIRGTSSQDAIVLRRNVAIETLRHPSENTGPALSHLHCPCTAIDLTNLTCVVTSRHIKTHQIKGLLALTFTNSKMIGMAQPTGRRMDQTFRRLLLGGSGYPCWFMTTLTCPVYWWIITTHDSNPHHSPASTARVTGWTSGMHATGGPPSSACGKCCSRHGEKHALERTPKNWLWARPSHNHPQFRSIIGFTGLPYILSE